MWFGETHSFLGRGLKFPALLINCMGVIIMTKEIITSLHFLLKKLNSSHPSACEQSSEEFASPEHGSEFRLPEHRSSMLVASARELQQPGLESSRLNKVVQKSL